MKCLGCDYNVSLYCGICVYKHEWKYFERGILVGIIVGVAASLLVWIF